MFYFPVIDNSIACRRECMSNLMPSISSQFPLALFSFREIDQCGLCSCGKGAFNKTLNEDAYWRDKSFSKINPMVGCSDSRRRTYLRTDHNVQMVLTQHKWYLTYCNWLKKWNSVHIHRAEKNIYMYIYMAIKRKRQNHIAIRLTALTLKIESQYAEIPQFSNRPLQ